VIRLSKYDKSVLNGEHGPGALTAMKIITRMAEVYGVDRLMDIDAAHIDSSLYMGDATLEFAEHLASQGARVVVPSTLNVSGVDEHGWQAWSVPPDWADNARRQMVAYVAMGCVPTWTCAPYQTEHRPHFGQQIAWGESNAIAFANSVIGARTERYPDLLDICAAITGRVPAVGYHLEENRRGQIHMPLVDTHRKLQENDGLYPVLGHLVGKVAQDKVPVLTGFDVSPTEDQLKAFGAAAASSGTVGLFHIVGITPEAPTIPAAFHGREPERVVEITMESLRAARAELSTAEGEKLDMVALGCPHFSQPEFEHLAGLLEGKEKASQVEFLVTSNRAMTMLAEKTGSLETLKKFGGRITRDTCILTTPMLPDEIRIIMTNSAKYAYYAPGMLNTQVVFGTLEDCVRSAIDGRVNRDEGLWKT
jgi:predicted aconitase